MVSFVQYRLSAQLNAHFVCTLHKFIMQINVTHHTSAPDRNIKERVLRGLYFETCNDVWSFYQWVLRDGFNLLWMWTPGKSGTAIISLTFSRRATSFKTGHRKDVETIQGDWQCGLQISNRQAKKDRTASGTRRHIRVCTCLPESSTREISEHCGRRKSRIWTILREVGAHPYRPTPV